MSCAQSVLENYLLKKCALTEFKAEEQDGSRVLQRIIVVAEVLLEEKEKTFVF